MSSPRRIAYYITPHGFGHAVRSLEIVRTLLSTDSGVEVSIVSDIPEFLVTQNIGHLLPFRRRRLDVGLVQLDSIRFDLVSTLSALTDLMGRAERLLAEEVGFLRDGRFDLVVADIPFLAFQAARRCRIPALAVGNFTWDWIYSSYAEQDPRWSRLIHWIAQCYGLCDLLLQLPMHGDCSACPVRVDVPLVARHSTRPTEETRRILGLGSRQPVYLLAFAALDLNAAALRAVEDIQEAIFLFKHPLRYDLSNGLCLDGFDLSYADVVAAVDAVITKPGYGIVSDCLAHGAAMIYTSRGHFPEYPILVEAMSQHLPVAFLPPEDLYAGRWRRALDEIRRSSSRPVSIRTDGAEVCAREILGSLEGYRPGYGRAPWKQSSSSNGSLSEGTKGHIMNRIDENVEAEGATDRDPFEEEPLVIPIEDSLDLHTFKPDEVKDLLNDYLAAAFEKGFREVRIIHGKGAGHLMRRVHGILERHPLVASFKQAEGSRGGWGATVVRLKAAV